MRKLIAGVPDDAELFFEIDVKNWPTAEIEWDDDTRIIAWDFENLSVNLENPPFQVVHFVIVGQFDNEPIDDRIEK